MRNREPASRTGEFYFGTFGEFSSGIDTWGASFTGASKRALGWTRGAHGMRHGYAQQRMRELQRILRRAAALEVVSQELGIFAAT